jgi:hypothetical protein
MLLDASRTSIVANVRDAASPAGITASSPTRAPFSLITTFSSSREIGFGVVKTKARSGKSALPAGVS